MVLVNGFPRRNRLDLNCPAELAIYDAMLAVEGLGAHPLLTEAVSLLGQAKEAVANWVELVPAAPEEPDVLPIMLNGRRVEYIEPNLEKVIVGGTFQMASDACILKSCQQGDKAPKLIYEDGKRICPVCSKISRNLPFGFSDER